mmetsp:Transcript_102350/g.294662  ORF Transcript_102350/g.294662 Transcript_102350/m.294662 type:complete len:205 (-) Transcript_102350:80-694(-)
MASNDLIAARLGAVWLGPQGQDHEDRIHADCQEARERHRRRVQAAHPGPRTVRSLVPDHGAPRRRQRPPGGDDQGAHRAVDRGGLDQGQGHSSTSGMGDQPTASAHGGRVLRGQGGARRKGRRHGARGPAVRPGPQDLLGGVARDRRRMFGGRIVGVDAGGRQVRPRRRRGGRRRRRGGQQEEAAQTQGRSGRGEGESEYRAQR